jgi:hypothetical protein
VPAYHACRVLGGKEDPCLCCAVISVCVKVRWGGDSEDVLSIKLIRYANSVSSSPLRFGKGSLPCLVRSGSALSILSVSSILSRNGIVSAEAYSSASGSYICSETGERSTSGHLFAVGKVRQPAAFGMGVYGLVRRSEGFVRGA